MITSAGRDPLTLVSLTSLLRSRLSTCAKDSSNACAAFLASIMTCSPLAFWLGTATSVVVLSETDIFDIDTDGQEIFLVDHVFEQHRRDHLEHVGLVPVSVARERPELGEVNSLFQPLQKLRRQPHRSRAPPMIPARRVSSMVATMPSASTECKLALLYSR